MTKTKPRYWYKYYIEECIECGRFRQWKERVTDRPKPDDPQKRYDDIEEVCYNCRYDNEIGMVGL